MERGRNPETQLRHASPARRHSRSPEVRRDAEQNQQAAHSAPSSVPAAGALASGSVATGGLPELAEMCKLLTSLARPLVLGLERGTQADVARGGLFPGTFTVVLRRSISLPWTFCM